MANTQKENKYIERTLLYVLLACIGLKSIKEVTEKLKKGLFIEILGDNDFYSQSQQVCHQAPRLVFLD